MGAVLFLKLRREMVFKMLFISIWHIVSNVEAA